MNDKELLAAFAEEMDKRGWNAAQAADAINVGRSTLFAWMKAGKVSKRGRQAMILYIPAREEVTAADPLLRRIEAIYSRLDGERRALLLAAAERLNRGEQAVPPLDVDLRKTI